MHARDVRVSGPVQRKIAGLNLPPCVEGAFVEAIVSRIVARHHGGNSGGLSVEASFPGDAGEWYDCYGWAWYTFDEGKCVITDFDVSFIER